MQASLDLTVAFICGPLLLISLAIGKALAAKLKFPLYLCLFFPLVSFVVSHIIMMLKQRLDFEFDLTKVSKSGLRVLIQLYCLPVIYFYIGYSFNLKIFKYSCPQVMVLGLAANMLKILIVPKLLGYMTLSEKHLDQFCLVLICIICMPYNSTYSVELLKNSTVFTNHIQHLLEGETITTLITALISLQCLKTDISATALLQHLSVVLINFLLGFVTNTYIGEHIIMTLFHCNAIAIICYSGSSLCFIYFLSTILEACAGLSIITLAVILRHIISSKSMSTVLLMDNFCKCNFHFAESIVFTAAGYELSYRSWIVYEEILRAVTIWFFMLIFRTCIFLCCVPIMPHFFGFLLSPNAIKICSTAVYLTSPPLLLAINSSTYGITLIAKTRSVIILLVLLHCLTCSLVFPLVCKSSEITNFSMERIKRICRLLDLMKIKKNKTISALEANVITANANWFFVNKMTMIEQPQTIIEYEKDHKLTMIEDLNFINNPKLHPDNKVPTSIPKKRSYTLLEMDIHRRSSHDLLSRPKNFEMNIRNRTNKLILEMELKSYNRQLEEKIISKKTHLSLISSKFTPILANSSELQKIKKPSLKFYKFMETMLFCCQESLKSRQLINQHNNYFLSSLFELISTPFYKTVLTSAIILDSISQLLIVYYYYLPNKTSYKEPTNYLQLLDYFCYGLFLAEFLFQVLGWGYGQYFKQKIWLIEFSISIIIRSIEQCLLHLHAYSNNFQYINIMETNEFIILLKLMFVLRLGIIKLYFQDIDMQYCKKLLEKGKINYLLKKMEKRYGVCVGHDYILPRFQLVFGVTKPGNKVKKNWLKLRKIHKINMNLINELNENLETIFISKLVSMNILKYNKLYFDKLTKFGHVSEFESLTFEENVQKMKNQMQCLVTMSTPIPKNLFRQAYWLKGDHTCRKYLLEHAEVVVFEKGQVITNINDHTPLLYMIISGTCRYLYKPNAQTIYSFIILRMLPNNDHYLHLHFQEMQEDIIEPGNFIGLFGIASERPSDVTIICESEVKALYVPDYYIRKQFYLCHFGEIRIAKLWKSIGIRLSVKHFAAHFKILSSEDLMKRLHRGIVPLLSNNKLISISEEISDIILIEGRLKDSLTRLEIFPPFHIKPRGQNLIQNFEDFPTRFMTPTRLMLVPKTGANLLHLIRSYPVFKNYHKFLTVEPMLIGKKITSPEGKRIKLMKKFLKIHNKYVISDLILQIDDPKITLPCCLSEDEIITKKNKQKNKNKKK